MEINEYQMAALRTANKGTEQNLLLNGVMGLVGEAGECVDLMKKHMFQGHDLDMEHFVKELGDCAWYLAVASYAAGYDLETVLQMNVDKLKARFPEGFDAERSIHRKEGDV